MGRVVDKVCETVLDVVGVVGSIVAEAVWQVAVWRADRERRT